MSEPADAAASPSSVALIAVTRSRWPEAVRVQGSLRADEEVVVGAKIAGRVEGTFVELGSDVSAGQAMATLERETFEVQVQQARAQVAEARAALGLGADDPLDSLDPEKVPSVLLEKAVYEEARQNLLRLQRLRASNAVSQAELDQQISLERVAAARYEAALNGVHEKVALVQVYEADLALAEQNLRDAIIRAPFDGVVQQRHVAAGAYVEPAAPIVTLVRTHPLRYRCMVPERRASRVRETQTVLIYLDPQGPPLETRIVRVSPSLDTASRSLVVEAEVPNPDGRYRAGMFAEAEVVIDPDATTLSVPAEAVGEFAGVSKVWLLRDGALQQQVVQLGRRETHRVEILEGVDEADRIVGAFTSGRPGPWSAPQESEGQTTAVAAHPSP